MADKPNHNPLNDVMSKCHMLDITSEVCPMTFVRTRIALDRLPKGSLLLVRLRGEEPRRSVPLSAASLGHQVLRTDDLADGTTELLLQRT